MRCRYAAPDRPLALCSLPALLKSDTDKKRLVGENWRAEENPRPQQIFDDVIFAGLEMEASVDICATSAHSARQSLSGDTVKSPHATTPFLSFF